MSLELWNTLATFGTFLVIAATALAALAQLRHMRRSNQIVVLSELYEKQSAPELVSAYQFVLSRLPEHMQDPAFRYQLAHKAERTPENAALIAKAFAVGNSYEEMGVLVKSGLVNRDFLLDLYGFRIGSAWDALSEFTAVLREHQGPTINENFEYLTVLSQDWLAEHASGAFPANVRRIDVTNKWREADSAYAASVRA